MCIVCQWVLCVLLHTTLIGNCTVLIPDRVPPVCKLFKLEVAQYVYCVLCVASIHTEQNTTCTVYILVVLIHSMYTASLRSAQYTYCVCRTSSIHTDQYFVHSIYTGCFGRQYVYWAPSMYTARVSKLRVTYTRRVGFPQEPNPRLSIIRGCLVYIS